MQSITRLPPFQPDSEYRPHDFEPSAEPIPTSTPSLPTLRTIRIDEFIIDDSIAAFAFSFALAFSFGFAFGQVIHIDYDASEISVHTIMVLPRQTYTKPSYFPSTSIRLMLNLSIRPAHWHATLLDVNVPNR